ncbi:MAG: GNAT family N-acetyltransferase [Armatimonadota bacterium]|nr:MAG: GNAT family N-acetyltransferase [Armatimonadota bacterium]
MVQPQLRMVLPSLDRVPAVTLPAGYSIRTYRPGDQAAWCRLIKEAIGGDYTQQRLQEEIAAASGFEPADLLFATSGEEPVGTAWARRAKDAPSSAGYLHMLAVAPEHRGHGLGRALVLSVLQRLGQMGLRGALLTTDDFRLPAIKLYLDLGFRPEFTHGSHCERWRNVYNQLGLSRKEIASEALSTE